MAQKMIFFPHKRRFNGRSMALASLFMAVSLVSFAAGLHLGAQYAPTLADVTSGARIHTAVAEL